MSQADQPVTPVTNIGVPDVVRPTEQTKNQYFPELDPDDWNPMVEAPDFKNPREGPGEERVFNAQYNHIVTQYYQEAVDDGPLDGQTVLKFFQRWKPIVSAFVRASLRGGEVDNELGATLSPSPNGSTQAYLRALRTDALTNASYYQTPSATGQYNIFPDEVAGDDTFATPTDNEQAWIIPGMFEYAASGGVPYDYIQAELNDATGVRAEMYARPQVEQEGTMALVEFTQGPLPAYPGIGVDIDVNAYRTGVKTGLFPLGFEVITESAAESGGVLGL